MNRHFCFLRSRLTPVYGSGEARALAFWVMEKAFGVERMDIYADKVRDFSEDDCERLRNICERMEKGEPVQYVLGMADFMGCDWVVTPDVLIPRPETEELVERTIGKLNEMYRGGVEHPRVLDAGTGSGCIAVSVALACPWAQVEAWDFSEAALQVAQRNAARLGAKVKFVRQDLLAPWPKSEPFHLIVSNPPYVCCREKAEMESHVLNHEPHTALFVPDDDPLVFYRALAQRAMAGALLPGGWLEVEINRAFGRETVALFESQGLQQTRVMRDSFDNDRMVEGRRL